MLPNREPATLLGAPPADPVEAERLSWQLPPYLGAHRLDILPAVLSKHIDLSVDGRHVARLNKPSLRQPWSETTFVLSAVSVVVAGIWHEPVMHTDVFAAGESLRDGRPIEDVGRSAPTPVTGYELWFRTGFTLFPGRFIPPWIAASAGVALLGLLAVWLLGLEGAIAGAIFLVAAWVLILDYVWTWFAATVRLHRLLLSRPELGDARRLAVISAAFISYPVVTLGALAAILIVAR
jgi:hypothetical protein